MPAMKRKLTRSNAMTPGEAATKRRKAVRERLAALGRLTGNIPASATTLSRAPGPFSGKKFVTFLYENAFQQVGGAANVLTVVTKPNDMYDYDNSGDAGNKQPLYYDTLLTASGPYRQYKVLSWKTTYYFTNTTTNTPVDIFISPPVAAASEFDSLAEADNYPGVKRLRLTGINGSKSYGEVTVTGHIKDVYPTISNDSTFVGAYNGSPTTIVYQVALIRGSDGATAPSVYVSVKHEAFTELSYVDALVS